MNKPQAKPGSPSSDSWLVPKKIEWEAVPLSPGWYAVKFPQVNDLSRDLGVWFAEVSDWLRAENIFNFSSWLHGRGKDKDRESVLFFFRDLYSARRVCWRFGGELHE